MIDIAQLVRDVPNFPKEGIIFKDITPVLSHPDAMKEIADRLAEPFKGKGIDAVAGIEARGWIFAPLIAERLGAAFVPVRKPGKLPYKKISRSYGLEYGTNTIEIHTDAIKPGQKVLMVDDLLATGGTMVAACELIEELGGIIAGCSFVIELSFLPGRAKLGKYEVSTLIEYAGE